MDTDESRCDCCGKWFKRPTSVRYDGMDTLGDEILHCRKCHSGWVS